MTPKQFLLEECANIELALSELLRLDYLAGGAADFHRELTQRLETIRRLIGPMSISVVDVHSVHNWRPIPLVRCDLRQFSNLDPPIAAI
jgi:hypothetical protein